jgi:hypothetical protein
MLQHGALLKATGMQGLGMPAGYSVSGSCDPTTGQPTGLTTGYYTVNSPSGVQCMSGTDPNFTALFTAAPQTPPVIGTSGQTSLLTQPALPPTLPSNSSGTSNPTVTNTDLMIGSFDATQFVSSYGIWLAVGAGVILLLATAK